MGLGAPRATIGATVPEGNRVALVTGASRGIGRGIVLELARAGGYDLAINYASNADAAGETVRACREPPAPPGTTCGRSRCRGTSPALPTGRG